MHLFKLIDVFFKKKCSKLDKFDLEQS